MLRVGRFFVPVLVLAGVVGVVGVTAVAHAQERVTVHRLTTKEGLKLIQTLDGRVLRVHVETARGNVPLRDGTYKLSNGGEIKVAGGIIVWDAFGVVEKAKAGQFGDPTG